ncbi:hypothetical protein Clacol_003068 [Clathrus columnatus]|uniref:Eukaryotic translation initiation factor 3 subunit H n=1 Tax=Clathrus columnatus TaxID=1419009 RepID=A0AAV5A868_9AGAM|nr:hypothetical protein Clacol_003068 [Clathrus columnatus]
MAANTMAAALAASLPAPQAAPAPATPSYEAIPASMAKVIDTEGEIPIKNIQLDGLVVSKIIKHGRDMASASSSVPAYGLLLGLDLDGTLEVSNCFAMPNSSDEDERTGKAAARYQSAMLRSLKEVQSDDSIVGFYQSTTLGAFFSQTLVDSLAAQRDRLRRGGVVVVHARGNAAFRAFRLTPSFIDAYKRKKFNTQSLIQHRLTFSSILEEVPLVIRTNALMNALIGTFTEATQEPYEDPAGSVIPTLAVPQSSLPPSFSGLDLEPPSYISSNLERIGEGLDDYKTEENNVSYLLRQITRERARADAYVQKRREENAARISAGLAPLPEEDVSRLFKIPAEPSRLDSMLLLGQLDSHAKTLENLASSQLVKTFASRV